MTYVWVDQWIYVTSESMTFCSIVESVVCFWDPKLGMRSWFTNNSRDFPDGQWIKHFQHSEFCPIPSHPVQALCLCLKFRTQGYEDWLQAESRALLRTARGCPHHGVHRIRGMGDWEIRGCKPVRHSPTWIRKNNFKTDIGWFASGVGEAFVQWVESRRVVAINSFQVL